MTPDGDLAQLLDRARRLALGGTEGAEVMLTDQQTGGLPHRGFAQRPEDPARLG